MLLTLRFIISLLAYSVDSQGQIDGSVNNKWLDGGWISEQLKDRWVDQGSIEGRMDSASGGLIRELRWSDGLFCIVVMFFIIC
jgi:hypothetical protein